DTVLAVIGAVLGEDQHILGVVAGEIAFEVARAAAREMIIEHGFCRSHVQASQWCRCGSFRTRALSAGFPQRADSPAGGRARRPATAILRRAVARAWRNAGGAGRSSTSSCKGTRLTRVQWMFSDFPVSGSA